jgi:Flp pilus assembly pilin Flp
VEKIMFTKVKNFLRDEEGASAVEYGLLVAGIAIAALLPSSWSAPISHAVQSMWRQRAPVNPRLAHDPAT